MGVVGVVVVVMMKVEAAMPQSQVIDGGLAKRRSVPIMAKIGAATPAATRHGEI